VDERYQVERCLSHGSYAEIFIALDLTQDGLQIIIKVLNAFLQGTPEPDLERTLIQNFQNEAIALDKVCHPNIIRRLGHGTASDLEQTPFHYLVLEYMPGGDLLTFCRNHPLDLKETVSYFEQVCSALAFAHSRQVIHRDVKPNNLLLSADRRVVKIADFGVARIAASESDEITRVGTNLYAPPEHHPDSQASELRQSLTPSADVYSMAKTIFTAMTGLSPRQFIRQPISSLPEELARQPWGAGLLDILSKATSTEVESRYQSVNEFWNAFSRLAAPMAGAIEDDPEATLVRSREGNRSNFYSAEGAVAVALATSSERPVEPGSGNSSNIAVRSGSTDSSGDSARSDLAVQRSEQESPPGQAIPQPVFRPHATTESGVDRERPQKARIIIPLPQPIERSPGQENVPPGKPIEAVPIEAVHQRAVVATPERVPEQSHLQRPAGTPDATAMETQAKATKPTTSAPQPSLLDRVRRNTHWLAWVRRLFVICMVLALVGFVAAVYLYFANPDGHGSVADVLHGSSYKDGAIAGAPNVNIHNEPNGDHFVVLPAGSRVRVLEERNNWVRVKVLHWEGTPPADSPDTGWVHRRYIKLD
jgi:serine/threonine protein kinase